MQPTDKNILVCRCQLKKVNLLKSYSLQSALHIVVFTYLEELTGHKFKDCRLVVTWVEMLFGMLKFIHSLLVMAHFCNEPSVNVSYASFLSNSTIRLSPQNISETSVYCHLSPLKG